MEFEDFVEPEVAVTAAVAAAVFSPRARKVMRKGLVYGMAGLLATGDAVTAFTRNIGRGMQQAGVATAHVARENGGQVKEQSVETRKESSHEATETPTATRRKTATRAESTGGESA